MNIYAKPGTKIVFTGIGGYPNEKEEAVELMRLGDTFTILKTEVGDFRTQVFLEEFGPNKGFNSTLFDDLPHLSIVK